MEAAITNSHLSDVSLVLWSIVATRGITTKTKVWELVVGVGYQVRRQTVNGYLTGQQIPPREFLWALDKSLSFTDAEKRKIERAFTWGVVLDGD